MLHPVPELDEHQNREAGKRAAPDTDPYESVYKTLYQTIPSELYYLG